MILLFSFFGLFGQSKKNENTSELKSGQIWKYNTRKGEEKSRIVILKVEDYGKRGEIVHIAVNGLKIKNKHIEGGISKEIGHLPFDKEAIIKSLTELESTTDELPDFMDGYLQWKEAFDSGKGGVFTIEVKEAVDFVDQSMNR
ncbi:hypothetical protein [uncultured Winogradskyella sp.]|uniref:hypothetical protein n=1 Tax=uncultured Winogradskyella sp. TaxID=395353 RepID=UPI002605E8EF|nr:hypothetical protein [uncultured Winogradskyella sp.]